jgi:hypothetical protein
VLVKTGLGIWKVIDTIALRRQLRVDMNPEDGIYEPWVGYIALDKARPP